MNRTLTQNSAMWLYLDHVARAFNDNDISIEMVLKPDITWDSKGIKLLLWDKVMEAQIGKVTTTKLTTTEVTEIYDIMNKVISMKTGIHIPFPDRQLQELEKEDDERNRQSES